MPKRAEQPHRRVIVEPGGPILVEGPVDLALPDGTMVCSDRFMVAICACRRSKRYPLCDTSHRKKVRDGGAPEDLRQRPS